MMNVALDGDCGIMREKGQMKGAKERPLCERVAGPQMILIHFMDKPTAGQPLPLTNRLPDLPTRRIQAS